MEGRPPLSDLMTEQEFHRWYWTMAELQPFARSLNVRATGAKAVLTERIAARLGGRPPPEETHLGCPTPQLSGSFFSDTEIPEGQRSTSELRVFFEAEIGPAFRFNGHLRAFLLEGGSTLGDAVAYWYATVGTELPPQSQSLEFNMFTKAWHRAHPRGTATDCRTAWEAYRFVPVDERPAIG